MAKVTPGFKLYLYQLLSRELGFGKQTLLPRVEEVLAADDIIAQDLECDTIQELVEACPDFLKLTMFKKGRAYATVLRNEEWDQMLAEPEQKQEPSPKKAAGGPKTWKKKKGGKKSLKAVKPGKQRRDREAAEARAAEEAAVAEAEAAARAAEEAAAAEALAAEEAAKEQAAAAEQVAADATAEAPTSEPAAKEGSDSKDAEAAPAAHSEAKTLAQVLAEARAAEEEAAKKGEAAAQEQAEPVEPQAPEPESQVKESAAEVLPAAAEEPEVGTPSAAEPAPAPAEPEAAPAEPEAAPAAPAAPEPEPISLTITYDPYEDMERELALQQSAETPVPPVAPEPKPVAPARAKGSSPIPLDDLPQDFASEVSCKDALLRALYQLLPYEVEPLAVLDEDWRVARSTASLSGSRNRVTFPLRYQLEDGKPIQVTLRKATRTSFGKRWNLALVNGDDGTGTSHGSVGFEGLPAVDEGAWADLCSTASNLSLSPVRELAQQVVIGTWDSFLGSLATMAAPERWNLPGEGVGQNSRYGILRDYITCTFHRIRCQEGIAHSLDGSFAAFNTGLTTSFGEDIYACLSARKGDIPYAFEGFATAGSGELGARLTGTIAQLPDQPVYLSSLESVVPAPGRMVILDLDTILGRQLGRLPRAFLAERLDGNAEASQILKSGSQISSEDLTRLSRAIKQDSGAYRRIRRALDDAVEQAMRSVKASYRLAAPVYDPTENRTKILVPLCLVEYGQVDCALVLDLQPSGAYRGASVLSLPRAYACARVISREQPSWLDPTRVL